MRGRRFAWGNAIAMEPEEDERRLLSFLGVYILLSIVAILVYNSWSANRYRERFASSLPDLLAHGTPLKPADYSPSTGHKVVVIDVSARDFDTLCFLLPAPVNPRYPEEVNTIAFVSYGQEVVGYYEDGAPGYRNTAGVSVLDLRSNRSLGTATFKGSNPPKDKPESTRGRSYSGSMPRGDIKRYLVRLLWASKFQWRKPAPPQAKPSEDAVADAAKRAEALREFLAQQVVTSLKIDSWYTVAKNPVTIYYRDYETDAVLTVGAYFKYLGDAWVTNIPERVSPTQEYSLIAVSDGASEYFAVALSDAIAGNARVAEFPAAPATLGK